jgi:hypothetical protein
VRWRLRRKWREGDWPRGIRISKPGTGRSAGKTCNMSWDGYGRQRKGIRSILILNSACASLPKAGAQCGSPARWDLSGGRRVTGVPTGIIFAYLHFWYFSGILNKSQVDANMKCWQICGNLNFVITSTYLCLG